MKPTDVTSSFVCPHCREILTVKVAAGKREPMPGGPLCACGHDRTHHVGGTGQCTYGHDTATGGCRDCTAFHSRRRGPRPAPKPTASPGDDRRRESQHPHARRAGVALGDCPFALLVALNEYAMAAGNPSQPLEHVTVRAGYSPRSGGTAKAIRELSSFGFVDRIGDRLVVTAAGAALAAQPEAARARDSLPDNALDHWGGKIGQCADLLLRAMVLEYPAKLTREQLGERTGYKHTSGGFAKAIRDLHKMGLAHDLLPSPALIAAMGAA